MSMIKVYREDAANAVVIDDGSRGSGGMRFNNELRAIGNGDGTVSILSPTRSTSAEEFAEVFAVGFADFADENGTQLANDEPLTVNALNAILRHTGGATGNTPVITSSTTINVTDGDTINYELIASYGVGYKWDNLPAGLVVPSNNEQKLIGVIADGPGTYSVTMTAVNYYGVDTKTLTIIVATPPFSNTRSVQFNNQDYLGANASLLSGVLGRNSNGSGASDAWTISLFFKPSTSTNGQTIFYFGDNDAANGGYINIRFIGQTDRIRLQYGSNNNYLRFQSGASAVTAGTWHHLMFTYDGGSTGAASDQMATYYGRFKVFIDGVNVISSGNWSHNNFGNTGGIDADNLRVGRFTSGNYMRDGCKVDELAIWDSDQSANISDIYNSGTPHDLSDLTEAPEHWWRMGDGDTYPHIVDNIGTADFVMYNMTAQDITTDAP